MNRRWLSSPHSGSVPICARWRLTVSLYRYRRYRRSPKSFPPSAGTSIRSPSGQRRRSCVSGRHGRDTGKAGRDMAVTKTHPIKSTLKAAIDYICNPEKTDGKLLVSAYGCSVETADIEFAWTRRHAIDKGTNLGRHLIQAFQPGEVTPEQRHEIGMELAKEILGGKYEFVLTTHIDKDHVHNHLIFNAVSFADHKHYHSNKRSYHFIRRTSDRLCKEHGLSIIVPGQDKGKSYIEHQTARTAPVIRRS